MVVFFLFFICGVGGGGGVAVVKMELELEWKSDNSKDWRPLQQDTFTKNGFNDFCFADVRSVQGVELELRGHVVCGILFYYLTLIRLLKKVMITASTRPTVET